VSIRFEDRNVAEIRCGRSKYRIAGCADRDFPKVPRQSDDAAECDAAALREMLEQGSYAVSSDDTRGAICGVRLEVSKTGEGRVESTDGHRLSRIDRKARLPRHKSGGATLCARGVKEILRLLEGAETCTASIDTKCLHVRVGGMTVSVSLHDGVWPPTDNVFPKGNKANVVVDRERLVDSLKRVSPLATDFRGVMIATSDGQALTDEVEAELAGDPFKVSVNAKYTLDCLTHMAGDVVTIRVAGEYDPVVFTDHDDAGHTAIVMPMRGN
jgi:DNA polymerase-3 subunit beta